MFIRVRSVLFIVALAVLLSAGGAFKTTAQNKVPLTHEVDVDDEARGRARAESGRQMGRLFTRRACIRREGPGFGFVDRAGGCECEAQTFDL